MLDDILLIDTLDLKRHKSKWPAVIFAIRRTLRVKGRMTFLTNSIITINLINALGVPLGTKWAKANIGCFTQDKMMWPIHRGRAILRANLKWLLLVKINGNRPRKLFTKTKKKIASKNQILPGFTFAPRIALNS